MQLVSLSRDLKVPDTGKNNEIGIYQPGDDLPPGTENLPGIERWMKFGRVAVKGSEDHKNMGSRFGQPKGMKITRNPCKLAKDATPAQKLKAEEDAKEAEMPKVPLSSNIPRTFTVDNPPKYKLTDLDKMPVKKLREIAAGLGYEIGKSPKTELITAIMAA